MIGDGSGGIIDNNQKSKYIFAGWFSHEKQV